MSTGLILGLGALILAGIGGGSIALPQKFVKMFAWENTWGTFWFFTMVVLPILVIPFCVNDIFAVWSEAGITTVLIPVVFGLLWGVGCVTYGGAVHMVGLSLGISVIMGTTLAAGALIPLIGMHSDKLATAGGCVVLLGIAVSLVGVALVGYAGMLKERALNSSQQENEAETTRRSNMSLGLAVALLSGVTSAGLNLGFAFSEKIPEIARASGTPAWAAQLASWQLVFWGGFATCAVFSGSLMFKNRTWSNFLRPGMARDTSLALTMAVINFATMLLYGYGAYLIGDLGTSLGFAAFMSITIVVANALGFITGEWRGVGASPVRWIVTAMAVLVISVCILGWGNSMIY